MIRRLVLFSLLFVGLRVSAQMSPEKLMGTMDRTKWIKAANSLQKALAKDSINPEARYLLSLYYYNRSNPAHQLDSAYFYVKGAQRNFIRVTGRDRDRLRKIPLDSLVLVKLRKQIDSVAFADATQLNSEEGYQTFIRKYPKAAQVASAIELRDEVAFLEALKSNTWLSFQKFMQKYPGSLRQHEARNRYEKLLYEDKTKDKKLNSYLNFYRNFPDSPFRSVAEKNIFEISTASGAEESFRWFIQNFPESPWSERSKNILFTLEAAGEDVDFEEAWMTDSLKWVGKMNLSYWVPVFKSGRFGFMDISGAEVIPPRFEYVQEDYLCGQVTDRLLHTSEGLIARNGDAVWKGVMEEAKDIGLGYLLITTDSGKWVMHESGFRVGPSKVSSAQTIAGRLVILQKNTKWSVYSLAGKELLPGQYDDVQAIDTLVVLVKGGKRILTSPWKISQTANHVEFKDAHVYDDVRRWGTQQYWVRNGVLEGVIGPSMNFTIPLDRHNLKKTNFGFLRTKDDKAFIEGIPTLANKPYLLVQEQGGWLRLQKEVHLQSLYDRAFERTWDGDSVWFQGEMAFLRTTDSVKAFLSSGQKLAFSRSVPFHLISYRDSTDWLVLEEKKNKILYDAASGIRLFSLEAEHIEPLSSHELLFTKGGKKGIVSAEGRIIVPAENDAIVPDGQRSYSLLKDKKFGWYDARSKILIKATYDRNLKSYNQQFRLAFKDRGYAFIYPDGKPVGLFEWEDVQYWTDSVAWVKKAFHWKLIDIRTGKARWERIRNFTFIRDSPQEKICLVRQDNAYGIISNRKGLVVPLQYSDIINLGSREEPMYFTERHIEEAGISVVVYYNRFGKVIRKQAMEAEEYEKIVCEQ